MPLSDYAREQLAEQLADLSDWDGPGTTYVGLFTAGPGPNGDANEVTNVEYERKLVGWKADGLFIENPGKIAFPEAESNWGTVTHFAAFDAQTGGNQLFSGKLEEEKSITAGDVPTFSREEMSTSLIARTVRTVSDWNNLPSYASHGDVVIVDGELDTYHFQYDDNLSSSKLGSGGWRLIPSLTGDFRFRKIPIGDGQGNLHPIWNPSHEVGVTYTPSKATVSLVDDSSYQTLLAYSNFYLPIKPIVQARGNFGGLTPSDMGADGGVRVRFGVDDQLEDTTIDDYSAHIIVRDSYSETLSRIYATDGSSSGGGGMTNEGADHLLRLEGQHEGGTTEWGQFRDLSTDTNVETFESFTRSDRHLGGRLYLHVGEFLSPNNPATYSITPPDVFLADIEVYC